MNALNVWRLYAYDVWGNAEEGFDVNDVFRTGDVCEVEEGGDVLKAFVAEGYVTEGYCEVDPHVWCDRTVYVQSVKHGNPIGEFRKEGEVEL